MPARLDDIDLRIVAELQAHGRMTNVELAARIGMSAPPCLRRVRSLEQRGILRGYRALVDERKLGFAVSFFAFVQLHSQSATSLDAFRIRIDAWDEVREAWTLSGDVDFVLRCLAPDMDGFQTFVAELTGTENVRTVRTSLALERVKDAPPVPVPERMI